jgi:hypothetical protein
LKKAYKTYGTISNPQRKRVNFHCEDCGGAWKKPVPYFIRHPHLAIEQLVQPYQKEICKRCAVREFGAKNKRRKKFFNEE